MFEHQWSVPVSGLASAIFPVWQKNRIMIMLQAYFDESGTNAACPVIGVAGYIATEARWSKFQAHWKRHLFRFKIDCFHMTDWENGWGQFAGWSEQKKHEAFQIFVGVIRRTFTFGVSAFTIKEHYKEWGPRSTHPYTFCVLQCLGLIESWAESNKQTEPMAYIFESGARAQGQLDKLIRHIQSRDELRNRFRVGSFTTAEKKGVNPLQAADILAYESTKEMLNYIVPGKEARRIRTSATILLRGDEGKYDYGYFDKTHLRKMNRSLTPSEWDKVRSGEIPRRLSFGSR